MNISDLNKNRVTLRTKMNCTLALYHSSNVLQFLNNNSPNSDNNFSNSLHNTLVKKYEILLKHTHTHPLSLFYVLPRVCEIILTLSFVSLSRILIYKKSTLQLLHEVVVQIVTNLFTTLNTSNIINSSTSNTSNNNNNNNREDNDKEEERRESVKEVTGEQCSHERVGCDLLLCKTTLLVTLFQWFLLLIIHVTPLILLLYFGSVLLIWQIIKVLFRIAFSLIFFFLVFSFIEIHSHSRLLSVCF